MPAWWRGGMNWCFNRGWLYHHNGVAWNKTATARAGGGQRADNVTGWRRGASLRAARRMPARRIPLLRCRHMLPRPRRFLRLLRLPTQQLITSATFRARTIGV